MKFKLFLFLMLAVSVGNFLFAQPPREYVRVIVTPDHPNWQYNVGEKAVFEIRVLKNNYPIENVPVKYRVQPEKMDVWKEATVNLKNGKTIIKTPKIVEPGFWRCHASVVIDGKTYYSSATAGFSPDKILPTTTLPDDFIQFWENAKKQLAQIPIKPVMTILPDRCTDKVDVYHVRINNINGKIYGILCKPKKRGKYPAILHVPGAGVRPYNGDIWNAEKGFVTFEIGIHGIPVTYDRGLYNDLLAGALDGYWKSNLDDKDNYYFKRVYLGCVRAVDFIESLDCFNGKDIGVTGGSQGGALSVVTAALDNRIDCLAALYPALSDLTGYLNGRAGGWPHFFVNKDLNDVKKIETSKYYDVVNFARFVKVPGFYSWGYNDNVCPPTSMYAAYNTIKAEKELYLFQETQHWSFIEQQEKRFEWLRKMLCR